jgi:hypothetical protein
MHRYGVKLNNGKVIWVTADNAVAEEGMLLFVKLSPSAANASGESASPAREVVAGFSIKEINHFARPEVLGASES